MKEIQTSVLIILVVVLGLIAHLILGFAIYPSGRITLPFTSTVLVLVFFLFYKLETIVDKQKIKIRFGIGVIEREFDIKEIRSVKAVRNSPLTGWGIRYHSDFVLYNVGGLHAIEIEFKATNQKVRIGSQIPEQLAIYISNLLSN